MIKITAKNYFSLMLVFAFALIQPISAKAQTLEQQVDSILSNWNSTSIPGSAVAYVEGGNIVFSTAYGMANLEHSIGWTTDTVTDLGSVSKQFLGFAFAMLAEQGKLSLDDEIYKYLPQLPGFDEKITIKHLFHHTSGLREVYNTLGLVNRRRGDVIFQEDAQTLVKHQTKLQFSPGSRYLYNNTEYMLLADILEAVTGQQFHEWMTDNIFKPLDMMDTHIMHRQGQVIQRVASSYVRAPDGQFIQLYDNSTIQGAGGIYSTVEDMAKWIANYSSHRVGNAEVIGILTETGYLNNGESLDYGLGIGIADRDGVIEWSHSGSSAGYRSLLVYLPRQDRGFIFVTNTPSNGNPGRELTRVFLGDVLDVPEPGAVSATDEEPDEVPLENLSQYAGRYLSDEIETFYTISLEADKLIFSHRWLGSFAMRSLGSDRFDLEGSGAEISFIRDDNNNVEKFILDNGRTIGIEVRRLE